MRTALKRALVAALLIATVGCTMPSDNGRLTTTVDNVDYDARTISMGGLTIEVPEEQNIHELQPGTKYTISYKRQDGHYVLTQVEDIVNCALYLASDESDWTNGAVMVIDGGITSNYF